MLKLEVTSSRDSSSKNYVEYHYDLNGDELSIAVFYISEELDAIIKRYISSGIILFNGSKCSTVKQAITDIYDRLYEDCTDVFTSRNHSDKKASLVNVKYMFTHLLDWVTAKPEYIIKISYV